MMYDNLGKYLLIIGAVVLVAGLAFTFLGKTPLGKLPGDFSFSNGSVSCFFPFASMILLSILLTIVVNVVLRLFNR